MRPLLCLIFVCSLASCGEEEAVRYQLTPEQREAFQAIAAERIDSMRPVLERQCQATREARIAAATDSIVQTRLEEELRLRARLGQTGGR